MLKRSIYAVLLSVLSLALLTPRSSGAVLSIGPNVDITQFNDVNGRQQVEPSIAVHPLNPSIIVAGAQDLRLVPEGDHRWHGYYRSTDGGQTWSVSLVPGFPSDNSLDGMASSLRRFNTLTDPVLAFDRHGNVYYTGIGFNILPSGEVDFTSLRAFVAKYTNDGATFAGATIIETIDADKEWIAIDTSGGPHDANVYLVFDATLPDGRFTSVYTRSADGGVTFSIPEPIPPQGGLFPTVAVDSAGDVFISTVGWDPVNFVFFDFLQVSKLTDGGSVLVNTAIAASGIGILPSPLPGNLFRVFTIPQIAANSGGAYVVWDDFRTGDSDVLFSRSTDGGTSWSTPIRVNDVTTNHQFFPSVAVSGGIISVVWYDSRLDDGGFITNLDVFYAQSEDGGFSFSQNFRVTNVSFDPNLVQRGDQPGAFQAFIGDYIHIAATPTAVYPIWADNRNACSTLDPTLGCVDQDVFTAAIAVAPTPRPVVVGIDIKPGSDPNSINVKSTGSIPVAILSSPTFDAPSQVAFGELQPTFGQTGDEKSLLFCAPLSPEDANGDGLLDLVCHFDIQRAGFKAGDTVGVLRGHLLDGTPIEGRDSVRAFFPGDANGDLEVNVLDLVLVGSAFGSTPGSPRWNLYADFNEDRIINILDLVVVGAYFGQHA